MPYGWKTEMYHDEDPRGQGQAAANDLEGGGLELVVMPAPNCFSSVVRLTADDRESLRRWLNGED